MEKLISFIIPAHNAELTIKNCINSISACLDERIEIIVVENGSSDKTYDMVNELSKKDERIRLVTSDKGVSNARNKGIELAKGKKIIFVDADDSLVDDAIDVLLEDANIDVFDLVAYGHISGNEVRLVSDVGEDFKAETLETAKTRMIVDPTKYMQVWAKIFDRDLINKNNIRFNPKLRLSEDSDFTLHYIIHCKSIKLSKIAIYNYYLNPVSTMRTFDDNKASEYIEAMKITSNVITNESGDIKKAFDKYVLMHINILMVREIFNYQNKKKYSQKMCDMRNIIRTSIVQQSLDGVDYYECKSFRMLPILFCKLGLYHFASVIYIVRMLQNKIREK